MAGKTDKKKEKDPKAGTVSNSAPRERGMLIDATYGRKTASIFIMDSDHVVLSALSPEKIAGRLQIELEREDDDL